MKKFIIILIAIVGGLLLPTKEVSATHTAGMDIFYRWKNATSTDSSYEFTLIFYRNCQGFTAGAPTAVKMRASMAVPRARTRSTHIGVLPVFGTRAVLIGCCDLQ